MFNLGSWNYVVLPTVRYWSEVKGKKTCDLGENTVTIADVKTGKDITGKHIDTQIVLFLNRDKVVLHCYNTTQLILVNGHGYAKLLELFLKPFFESKIDLNTADIEEFNKNALESLGSKMVKRSDVKYRGGPTYLWCTKCDFAAKSRTDLVRHKKIDHVGNNSPKTSPSTSLVLPQYHSTRNNSIMEPIMQENISITDLSTEVTDTLKYTCLECKFKTREKGDMNKHVQSTHTNVSQDDIQFICVSCEHTFSEKEDFNKHLLTHKKQSCSKEILMDNGNTSENTNLQELVTNEYHQDEVASTNPAEEAAEETELEAPPKVIVTVSNCILCGESFETECLLKTHKCTGQMLIAMEKETIPENVIICGLCTEGFESMEKYKMHETIHDKSISCNYCDNKFKTRLELEWHIETEHACVPIKCTLCDVVCKTSQDVQQHMSNKHSFPCIKCPTTTFQSRDLLLQHNDTYHSPVNKIPIKPREKTNCDQCGYKGLNESDLISYLINEHSGKTEQCRYCERKFLNAQTIRTHIETDHVEFAIMDHIMGNLKIMDENSVTFEKKMTNVLNLILDNQNEIKQELFISRQNDSIVKEKMYTIERAITSLNNTISGVTSQNANLVNNVSKPIVPEPVYNNTKKDTGNILLVGTSLTNKLNKQVIQNVTDSKVTVAKAFTIDAKDGAVRPDLNHKKVVPMELSKQEYDTLVLDGGVNEISNIDTSQDFIANIDVWKQKVANDSINMFRIAEESLTQNKTLKKVVVLKRIFRCDDPIKQSLSEFANSVYDEIWNKRGRPSNIYIADQKLNCDGKLRAQRYGGAYDRSFDGVHLRGELGTQHYTRSMIDVFTAVYPHILSNTQRTQHNTANRQVGNF